jgi:murein DD-endopeptidase MepM/ murein hydrolase activator NlpD
MSAGLSANQIMELAGIFGWDIDFALDIRSGDSFKLLYQEKIVEGEVVDRGNIIAATFINQGTNFTAVLDDNTGNYYDPSGRAMKKAFLRSPLDFRRVSSNFNPSRLHPVTGQVKAHRGTDYVAPIGTPIWAAGDGVVEKSSYNQFNGNYVFIRHSNTYITKYLHLTKRTVKTGQRVKQGQVIGTLGRTGRVTGAHLHYEFLVNGVHKNPRTVSLPQSQSLTGKAKQTFIANAEIRLKRLDRYGQLLYAN